MIYERAVYCFVNEIIKEVYISYNNNIITKGSNDAIIKSKRRRYPISSMFCTSSSVDKALLSIFILLLLLMWYMKKVQRQVIF